MNTSFTFFKKINIICKSISLSPTYSTFLLLASSQLTMSIHWPCNCTVHVYIVIHFYDSMWSFWVEVNLCRAFICTVYCLEDLFIKRWRVGIPFTSLTHHIFVFVLARNCISNVICHVLLLCSMICGEGQLSIFLILVELLSSIRWFYFIHF